MMRIISILLLVAGLLAAGLGGARLLEEWMPRQAPVASAPPPLPMTGPPGEESAGDIQLGFAEPVVEAIEEITPEIEIAAAEAAPPAPPIADDSAAIASAADEAPLAETDFLFQPMVEEPAVEAAPRALARSALPAPLAPAEAVDIETAPASKAAFIETLKTVPVAHETPRSAEYKRAFNVTFAIDAAGGDSAADALPGRGVISEAEAMVSDRVEVRLSGASFDILPTSPGVQNLSPLTENVWRWSVTPLSAGDHDLVFEIFAIDADSVVPLRTFRDTVTVRVSGLNHAIAFADQANPLFVLLGGLGSILAGAVGVIRFFAKK